MENKFIIGQKKTLTHKKICFVFQLRNIGQKRIRRIEALGAIQNICKWLGKIAKEPKTLDQTNKHSILLRTQLETTQMYLTTLKNTFVRNLQTVFDTKTKLYPNSEVTEKRK